MKKQIPLEILRTLEQCFKDHEKFISVDLTSDSIVVFRDKDSSSGFHFTIEAVQQNPRGAANCKIAFIPNSKNNLALKETSISATNIKNTIDQWVHLVKEYDKPSPLFDDPITQHYYEELNPYFEILDEDADRKPFPMLKQQLLINYYELLIEEVLQNKDEGNVTEAEAVVVELKQAQKAVSKSTKKNVIRTLQRNIAKLWKFSTQVGAKAIASLAEEGVKDALKAAGLKAAEIALKLLG